MLDKVDPPTVPDGYGLSVGFYCLVEAVRTIQFLVEGEYGNKLEKAKEKKVTQSEEQEESGQAKSGMFVEDTFYVNTSLKFIIFFNFLNACGSNNLFCHHCTVRPAVKRYMFCNGINLKVYVSLWDICR
jgi:hypothetical protein